MNNQSGQSLVELLVALGFFALIVSLGVVFILDIYLSDQLGREITKATFLAREGVEAAKSIKDKAWDDLLAGVHGLSISDQKWIFDGNEEDINFYLKEGKRKIIVEDIDENRKKVTSIVSWELKPHRPEEVSFVVLLTNWTRVTPISEDCNTHCQSLGYVAGVCRTNSAQCKAHKETYESTGDEYCTGGKKEDTCCCAP